MRRQRVAVVGIGSVGGVFASELLLAERHDVQLCARRPFEGLYVESDQVPASHPDVVGITDPGGIDEPVDWVLLATKAHQTMGSKPWLDALCGPNTTLVVVQNGIEQLLRGEAVAPQSTVLPAVVYCGASMDAPGRIVHTDRCALFVPPGVTGDRLVELFEGTRARITAGPDYRRESFQKFMVNVVLNGPCAITDQPGSVYRRAEMSSLAAGLIDDVLSLAEAEGVVMAEGTRERTLGLMESLPAGLTPSTLQDRRAGRPFEHDAITGAALRLAERHGLEVPYITAVHGLLSAIDPGRVAPD